MTITTEIVVAGTAIFAVIISFITLWLAHLRGASIKLIDLDCKTVKMVVKDENKKSLPFVLESNPDTISVYFMNGGNRAGYIKRVYATFELEKQLKDFCRQVENIGSFEPEHTMIKDKEIKEIKWSSVNLCVDKICFEDVDWKRFSQSSDNDKKLNEILDEMIGEKKRNFENFILVLEKIIKAGNITISYELTNRIWKSKSEQLDIVIDKGAIEKYKSLWKRIDEISKHTKHEIAIRLLRFINDDLEKVVNSLGEYAIKDLRKNCESEQCIALDNVKKLIRIKQEEKFRFLCRFDKNMQACDYLFEEIVRFYQDWNHSKGLDPKMMREIIIKYNLEERRRKLLKDVEELLPQIEEFCKEMREKCSEIAYLEP